jgi:hypothetical protein
MNNSEIGTILNSLKNEITNISTKKEFKEDPVYRRLVNIVKEKKILSKPLSQILLDEIIETVKINIMSISISEIKYLKSLVNNGMDQYLRPFNKKIDEIISSREEKLKRRQTNC